MMLFIYSPALAAAIDCINIRFHTGSIRTPADESRLGGMGSHHSVRDPVAVRHHSVWVNWLLTYLFFLLVLYFNSCFALLSMKIKKAPSFLN
jgi:hypothetical protein